MSVPKIGMILPAKDTNCPGCKFVKEPILIDALSEVAIGPVDPVPGVAPINCVNKFNSNCKVAGSAIKLKKKVDNGIAVIVIVVAPNLDWTIVIDSIYFESAVLKNCFLVNV
ncbi:hypothetical protein II5_05865 [Bacillus cereus MSX-A1]|nr:hypothetical protein II5_05865 [Bacillus cereus MSX-A1]